MRGNVVTVLTSKAIAAKDIKVGTAEAVLRSEPSGATPEGRAARRSAEQARASCGVPAQA